MIRSAFAAGVLALGLILASSCSKPDPSLLASFDGGGIRVADLDARILMLPANQRGPEKGQDPEAWRAGLVRDLAFERLLVAEARRTRAEEDPAFAKERTALRKRLLASLYLEKHLPRPTAPSEAEVRAYYDEHPTDFRRLARREVYTIFKRVEPGADAAAARREMEAIRGRVLAGEPFAELAAAHSDSETRHRKGLWGWVQAGGVGGDLEKVVFSLAEETPSRVLSTRDGLHLFWVSETEPEVRLEFSQARTLATRMVLRDRQRASVHELLDPHGGTDSFVPSPKELSALLTSGDPKALILSVGGEKLHLDELTRLVMEADQASRAPLEIAQDIVEDRWRQEVASKLGLQEGLDRSKAFIEREPALEERALADFQLKRQLRAEIDEAALARYFEDNRQRYMAPLLVRTEVLSVPLSPSAPRHMAEMERARPELDAGRTSLAELARRLGGQSEDMGWRTLDQLGQTDPGLPYWALELAPERHSSPFRTTRALVILKVLSRRDPGPQTPEAARPRLIEDYVRQHGQDLRASLEARWLREKHFEPARPPVEGGSDSHLTRGPS